MNFDFSDNENPSQVSLMLQCWCVPEGRLSGHGGFALAHVLLLEQELPVQVGYVDGVQVNYLNVLKSCKKY